MATLAPIKIGDVVKYSEEFLKSADPSSAQAWRTLAVRRGIVSREHNHGMAGKSVMVDWDDGLTYQVKVEDLCQVEGAYEYA